MKKRPYIRKAQHAPPHAPVHVPAHEPARVSGIPQAPTGMTRKDFDAANAFDIDPDIVASFDEAGWDLNFKTETVFGEEQTQRMKQNHANGWQPVDPQHVPGVMPNNHKGDVRIGGTILMQRPKYLTEQAEAKYKRDGSRQVSSHLQETAVSNDGEGPRTRPMLSRDWGGA